MSNQAPIHYKISHTTRYKYQQKVSCGQNLAWVRPKVTPNQQVLEHNLSVKPSAQNKSLHTDYFDNQYYYFGIEKPHESLTVTAESEVIITPIDTALLLAHPLSWELGRMLIHATEADFCAQREAARQFSFRSPLVEPCANLSAFYQDIFLPEKPLIAACFELTQKIYREFTYQSNVTDIHTKVAEVYEKKIGVCQDFAHFAIACLREMGLAARYVSGYIENSPPPGVKKLRGSDASHAWFGVYVPDLGWVDFDPTNNCMPSTQHIVLAHGRDYSDVPPLKGVVVGSGSAQLFVEVDVDRKLGTV